MDQDDARPLVIPDAVVRAVDATVAVALPVLWTTRLVVRGGSSVVRPVAWAVHRPVGALARRGRVARRALQQDVAEQLAAVLDVIVPEVVDQVLGRVDVTAIASDVIASLDLPELMREATSAVPSETVREVRMRGIEADDVVARTAGRLRLRRHRDGVPAAPSGTPGR
jgi:hypothetical protein